MATTRARCPSCGTGDTQVAELTQALETLEPLLWQMTKGLNMPATHAALDKARAVLTRWS